MTSPGPIPSNAIRLDLSQNWFDRWALRVAARKCGQPVVDVFLRCRACLTVRPRWDFLTRTGCPCCGNLEVRTTALSRWDEIRMLWRLCWA